MKRALADGFELDDDRERVDVGALYDFLTHDSYWGLGRSRELVEHAVRGSTRLVGLYRDGTQVGFARAVSDGAVFAYLADVYVLAPYRGRGLGLELVREMVENGPYESLTWILHTADAAGLYEKVGFVRQSLYPVMERRRHRIVPGR